MDPRDMPAVTRGLAPPLDDTGIARLVELTEAAAYADMLRAAPAAWRCVEERSPAGWFLFAPALDTCSSTA